MEELFAVLLHFFAQGSKPTTHSLPEELIDYLRSYLIEKTFKKNDLVLKEGQICKRIHFIKSGLIRHFSTRSGEEKTTWILREKHIFISVDSFFNQTPALDNIQALEDLVTLSITYDQLIEACLLFPEFATIRDQIKSFYYSLRENRTIDLHGLDTRKRYDWLLKTEPEFSIRVPVKILASYLDMSAKLLYDIRKELYGK
jgi:CRP-like cAMP-binding protein